MFDLRRIFSRETPVHLCDAVFIEVTIGGEAIFGLDENEVNKDASRRAAQNLLGYTHDDQTWKELGDVETASQKLSYSRRKEVVERELKRKIRELGGNVGYAYVNHDDMGICTAKACSAYFSELDVS